MDFQDSIHVLGFSDELNKLLLQLYLDNRKEIRSILGELAPKLPSYHSLEWRLDVQVTSVFFYWYSVFCIIFFNTTSNYKDMSLCYFKVM